MKYLLIASILAVVSFACTKKYYLTASGGERPLPEKGDVFKMPCIGNAKPIIDTNYYYIRQSIGRPEPETPLYRYFRFVDGCRLMLNKSSSENPAYYASLENPDGEQIGKYTVNLATREIVMKTFTALKNGIVIDNYGTVSQNGDTITIRRQDIPGIKNAYIYHLIKTNIPVKNKIVATW